jgi:hypothetical protein
LSTVFTGGVSGAGADTIEGVGLVIDAADLVAGAVVVSEFGAGASTAADEGIDNTAAGVTVIVGCAESADTGGGGGEEGGVTFADKMAKPIPTMTVVAATEMSANRFVEFASVTRGDDRASRTTGIAT